MSAERLEGRPIGGDDADLVAALRDAGLPIDDLTDEGRRFFRFQGDGGGDEVIGYGGWERLADESILIRSLIVPSRHRGRGVGGLIVDWLLATAAQEGNPTAYLITMDQASWFKRFGFRERSREQAPPELRACRQYASLCPASAVVMSRDIIKNRNI